MAAGFDIISDVHGRAGHLEQILTTLGYTDVNGVKVHDDDRRALFLGDLINIGDENERVLNIVKSMVGAKSAECILGNHEFGCISYATKDLSDETNERYLIPHGGWHDQGFRAFLEEFPFGSKKNAEAINWFKTLPLSIHKPSFLISHAMSPEDRLVGDVWNYIRTDYSLKDEAWQAFSVKGSSTRKSLKAILFGEDVTVPSAESLINDPVYIYDSGYGSAYRGKYMQDRRVSWWNVPREHFSPSDLLGFHELDLCEALEEILGKMIDEQVCEKNDVFYAPATPVFFGHYELEQKPHLTSPTAMCLDFKGGVTAYRYNMEDGREFFEDRLVHVDDSGNMPQI